MDQCSICLKYIFSRHCYKLLKCKHTFHKKCILQLIDYYNKRRKCPCCRAEIGESDLKALDYHLKNNLLGRTMDIDLKEQEIVNNSAFLPSEVWWSKFDCIEFSNPNLTLAARCLQNFWCIDSFQWYHVQIPYKHYNKFYESMQENSKKKGISILPFTCWCDKKGKETHKHVIVISCISMCDYKYTENKLITNVIELIRIITSVSTSRKVERFYINCPLPNFSDWILACLWPEGIHDIVQEHFEQLTLHEQFLCAMKWNDDWRVCGLDLPNTYIPKDYIIPISSEYRPTKCKTPYFIFLSKYVKVYFEKDENLLSLDDATWNKIQKDGNNQLKYMLLNTSLNVNTKREVFDVIKYYFDENINLIIENKRLKSIHKINPAYVV